MSVKKKILLGIPLLLVALPLVAYVFIGLLAKKAVELGGEQAMGVPTSLENITLKPFSGQGSIEGLKVSNPGGFKTPFFMKLLQWPLLRRIPGRLLALGVRPEHVHVPAL